MPWSLESELRDLLQADDLESAFRSLGVLHLKERLVGFIEPGPWYRGGIESYLYDFRVQGDEGTDRQLLLKAYVPLPGADTVVEGLQRLLDRRHLLATLGVGTPRLFGSSGGVVCEDYLPDEFWPLLERPVTSELDASKLLLSALTYACALDVLRFAPLDPYLDLRTDGVSAVVVDFGQDLGPPYVATPGRESQNELIERLQATGRFARDEISSTSQIAFDRVMSIATRKQLL